MASVFIAGHCYSLFLSEITLRFNSIHFPVVNVANEGQLHPTANYAAMAIAVGGPAAKATEPCFGFN
jgi:hypothetical protein